MVERAPVRSSAARARRAGAQDPALVVTARVGQWPGWVPAAQVRRMAIGGGVRAGIGGAVGAGLAESHAERAWLQALGTVIRQARGIRAAAGWNVERMGALADLAFAGALGAHVRGCGRCVVSGDGGDEDSPLAWLTWAVRRRRNLATVFEPVLLEVTDRSARTARNDRADGSRRGRAAS